MVVIDWPYKIYMVKKIVKFVVLFKKSHIGTVW
jgi:hypothetical protein